MFDVKYRWETMRPITIVYTKYNNKTIEKKLL